jgi:hypothetical protein
VEIGQVLPMVQAFFRSLCMWIMFAFSKNSWGTASFFFLGLNLLKSGFISSELSDIFLSFQSVNITNNTRIKIKNYENSTKKSRSRHLYYFTKFDMDQFTIYPLAIIKTKKKGTCGFPFIVKNINRHF